MPQLRLRVTLLAILLAFTTLAGCKRSTSVGSFVLDVPPGWVAEREDQDTLTVRKRHPFGWMWALVTFSAPDTGEHLDQIGRAVARELATEDSSDEVSLELGAPRKWTGVGVEGIVMDGTFADAELSVNMKVLVATTGDRRYLVAMGVQGPDATARDDAKMREMLSSIRVESPF